MKRNQIKMIAAALCVMMVMASGCGKQSEGEEVVDSIEEQSGEPSQEVTFQDQYDLGMRLLSEGSYEEAIIAFTAALEINPKSVDTYIALADIYETLEDRENLQAILEQGVQETGDEGLAERLEELTELLRMPPELPEELRQGAFSFWLYGGTKYREDAYIVADERLEAIFAGAIENGFSEDKEWPQDEDWLIALGSDALGYLEENGNENIYKSSDDGNVQFDFWTKLSEGGIFYYAFNGLLEAQEHLSCEMDYRPQEGMGFHVYVWRGHDASGNVIYDYSLVQGEIRDWLYNGTFTEYALSKFYYSGDENAWVVTYTRNGTARDELLQGELVTKEENHPVDRWGTGEMWSCDSTIYEQYDEGRVQILEMRGDEPIYARIYRVYEGMDDEEEESFFANDYEDVCAPYTQKNYN